MSDSQENARDLAFLERWLTSETAVDKRVAARVLLAIVQVCRGPCVDQKRGVPFTLFRDIAFPDRTEPVAALGKQIEWARVERWWDDRSYDYLRALPAGVRPLRPFIDDRRPQTFGWAADGESADPKAINLAGSTIKYQRQLLPKNEINPALRWVLTDSGVNMQSWRKWLIRLPLFIALGLATSTALIFVANMTMNPAKLFAPASLVAIFGTGIVWRFYAHPFLALIEHRIYVTEDFGLWLRSGSDPAQLELLRGSDGLTSRFDLVRYTSECDICGSPLRLSPGRKDHQRYLVGRCIESPDEHVFSFDRWSREGQPLLARRPKNADIAPSQTT